MQIKMQNQTKYLITIGLTDNIQSEMDILRRKYYNASFRRIPSHLTIMPPFFLRSNTREENLRERLLKFTKYIQVIPIKSNGLRVRFKTYIVGEIIINPPMRQIAESLPKYLEAIITLAGKPTDGKFVPHITLAKANNPIRRRKIAQKMGKEFKNFAIYSNHLLLWRFEKKRYRVIKKFLFSASEPA